MDAEDRASEERRTQLCDDCGAVIKVHKDDEWRLELHAIRCETCFRKARELGYNWFEAKYVS